MCNPLQLLVLVTLALAGCATLREDGGRDFEATWPDTAELPKAQPGAIYAQGTETALWQNVTARNIGDTLTIKLEESTEAEKSATSTSSKSTSATLTGPTVLGRPVTMNGTPILEGSLGTDSKFAGNGAAAQSNKLDG